MVDSSQLQPFLSDPEPRVATAALQRLCALSDPLPALPLLLERLGGDDARVAAFGVRASLAVNPARVVAALEGLILPQQQEAVAMGGVEGQQQQQEQQQAGGEGAGATAAGGGGKGGGGGGFAMKVTAQKEAVRLLEAAGSPEVREVWMGIV